MTLQKTLKQCFSNVSNSSLKGLFSKGYFLQPANIMTFFVELKGRFPMTFLEKLWHFLYLHIYDKFQSSIFPFFASVTPSLMFSLVYIIWSAELSEVLYYDENTYFFLQASVLFKIQHILYKIQDINI